MVSGAQLDLLLEDADEYQDRAIEALENDDQVSAAEFLRESARLRLKVASNCNYEEEAEGHLKEARMLRGRANIVDPRTGQQEQGQDSGSGLDDPDLGQLDSKKQGEVEADLSDTRFFDDPPDKDLSDVGGMEELKDSLKRDVQKPLEHPEFYEKQESGIENGVLFYGPPGTGKSYLAKCFAGELDWSFANIHASEIGSKYVNKGAENVAQLFEEARSVQPAVVFLDELDALASDRTGGPRKTNSERKVVNELLQCMEEVQGSDILVVAATNTPDDLDSAITRSERFNQEFYVGAPDAEARMQILGVQLDEGSREVDWNSMEWKEILEWTQGFSAADLQSVVRKAARLSAEESTEKGVVVPVKYRHVRRGLKEVEPSLDETD